MGHNAQARHSILDKAFVAEAVELAFASDAIQPDADGFEIDGTVNGFLQAGGQPLLFSAPDTGHPASIPRLRGSSLASRPPRQGLPPPRFRNQGRQEPT